MKILLDTSVLVTALVQDLPRHEEALSQLRRATSSEHSFVVSAHTLAECYATLTALPISPAVLPGQARRLIEENIAGRAEQVVALDGSGYVDLIERAAGLGLQSGSIYDVLHVACAESACADELVTFNGRDFKRMPPTDPTRLVVL